MQPVIDVAALLTRLAGDGELLQELLGVFLDDLPIKIAALRQAQAEGDLYQVSRRAHAIKGSVGVINADSARECAAELEMAAVAGDAARVDVLVDALLDHLDAVVTCIEDIKTP
ncbi:MAG: Hpt domain-containing protein [Desulfovibrionaceae bacterium]